MDLSIIVPVYNVELYLRKCLDSLVKQPLDNFEIVCINDGSTDNSLKILEEYKERYPEIVKIYNKQNGGLSDARNYGLKKAEGKYVGFVDSDDWVDKNMFKVLLDEIQSKNCDVVVCNYVEVYKDKNIEIVDCFESYKLLYEACIWNKIFNKSLFTDNDIYFPKGVWYEDNGTTYRLLAMAKSVSHVNMSLYYYRKNRQGSIMNSQKSNKIYDIYEIGNILYKYYLSNNFDETLNKQMEYIFIKNIFFRHVNKIISLELPNIFKIRKKLKFHCRYLSEKFPEWKTNEIMLSDKNNYFKNKLGKRYLLIIKIFEKILI